MLWWSAVFRLYDIDNPWGKIYEYTLTPWNRLFVLPRVAHNALLEKGATLLWFTEEPYISPSHNDKPYDMDKVAAQNMVNKKVVEIIDTIKNIK